MIYVCWKFCCCAAEWCGDFSKFSLHLQARIQAKLHTTAKFPPTTPKNNIPATKTAIDPHSPEHQFVFIPPSRSIRPNQRAGTLPGQLVSPTSRRLVQLNLESLSNSLLQPPSKWKTYSPAYSLPSPKWTRQSKRVQSSKQDTEDPIRENLPLQ